MLDFVAFPVERVEYGSDRNSQCSQNLDRLAWGGGLVNPRAPQQNTGLIQENVTVGGDMNISEIHVGDKII